MKVSIIVPAYNEEMNIKDFLLELSGRFTDSEIIVVCNGCTDRTPEIVKNIKNPNIKLISLPKPNKGSAILRGFEEAKYDYLGFVDADRAFRIDDIEKIVSELKDYDSVIASKWKDQSFSSVNWPFTRKLYGRVWNSLVRNFLKLDFEDTQAGVKFLRRNVYEAIDKNFIAKGFEFDIELLLKIQRRGFKIKEVFTPVQNSKKSSVSVFHAPKMVFNLLRLSLKY